MGAVVVIVVVHAAHKAGDPEGDARPAAQGGLRAAQVRRSGDGHEEGHEEEAVRHVECNGARDKEARCGAGGGTGGRDEHTVEVVREIECGKDGRGAEAEGSGRGRAVGGVWGKMGGGGRACSCDGRIVRGCYRGRSRARGYDEVGSVMAAMGTVRWHMRWRGAR